MICRFTPVVTIIEGSAGWNLNNEINIPPIIQNSGQWGLSWAAAYISHKIFARIKSNYKLSYSDCSFKNLTKVFTRAGKYMLFNEYELDPFGQNCRAWISHQVAKYLKQPFADPHAVNTFLIEIQQR